MNTYRIAIGDWSNDGHGQKDMYTVRTSHNMKDIVAAYRKSVKKSGVALDNNTKGAKHRVCVEYEDSTVNAECVQLLTKLGVNWDFRDSLFSEDGSLSVTPEDVAHLFMEMVKTQIPEFAYEFAEEPPVINASDSFRDHIGYGCYN